MSVSTNQMMAAGVPMNNRSTNTAASIRTRKSDGSLSIELDSTPVGGSLIDALTDTPRTDAFQREQWDREIAIRGKRDDTVSLVNLETIDFARKLERELAARNYIEVPLPQSTSTSGGERMRSGMWDGTQEDRARAERDCAQAPRHCFHKNDDGSFTCCWCPAVSL